MSLWSALNAPFPDVRAFWLRLWAPKPPGSVTNVPACKRCLAPVYARGPWIMGLPADEQPWRDIWCDCPGGKPTM